MKPQETEHTVVAWSFRDTLLEWHEYPAGPAGALPPHVHEEYQFCLSLDTAGEYDYRRARHGVPVGSLSVIHPGEVHAARDPDDRIAPATYRVMYVCPCLLKATADDIAGRPVTLPFFVDPILLDPMLAARFLGFHIASEETASRLELDTRHLALLTQLVLRHTDASVTAAGVGQERGAVRRVREYLEDNYAENVSLDQLARLVELSPYHLTRVFRGEVGLPPHAYQLGVRLTRAKGLLLQGSPVSRVAFETGFADQSHLTRHFKRLVGTPPGHYARERKNVQAPRH